MNGMSAKERFQEQCSVDVSPLVDMVFILLVFFVVTTVFVAERGLAVNTPSGGEPLGESETIELRITRELAVTCNGEAVTLADLPSALGRFAGRSDGKNRLITHPDAPASLVVAVLDACADEKIGPVSLSSEREI